MYGVAFDDQTKNQLLRDAIKAVRAHANNCSNDLASKLRYVADVAENGSPLHADRQALRYQ